MTDALAHVMDRTVVIRARRETVFRYFTESAAWASWWGQGSTIDPRAGGRVVIRFPGGVEIAGAVVESAPPERIAFTYGFTSGKPMPEGASLVGIRLEAVEEGTRLVLTHAFADPAIRDQHVQGWRHQLAVLANVVADAAVARVVETVDAWLAAWSEPDRAAREATVTRVVAPSIRFRDRFSLVEGLDDLLPHLAAVHVFMPGMKLTRTGDVRHCLGRALADWIATGADGAERGRGTNAFFLDADGRIEEVTGFWELGKRQAAR